MPRLALIPCWNFLINSITDRQKLLCFLYSVFAQKNRKLLAGNGVSATQFGVAATEFGVAATEFGVAATHNNTMF